MRLLLTILIVVFSLSGSVAQQYFLKNYNMKSGLAHSQVLSIYQDQKGYLWFGTSGGGLSKFNGSSFKNYDLESGLTNTMVRALTSDNEGRLWIGTMGGGLNYLENDSIYSFEDSLITPTIFSLYTDVEGKIWVGHSGGLTIIDNFKTSVFDTALPNYAVTHITDRKNGEIWFHYNDNYGIYRYHNNSLTHYNQDDGITNKTILFSNEDKNGTMWFGTEIGLYSFKKDKFLFHGKEEGLPEEFTFDITEDRQGNLIIGCLHSGFIRWNQETGEKEYVNHSKGSLTGNVFRSFTDKEGSVWMSAYGKGIIKFNDKLFLRYGKSEGLSDKHISSISCNGDSTWIANHNGLYLGVNNQFKRVFKNDINQSVVSVYVDKKQRVWFTGENLIGYIANNKVVKLDSDHKKIVWGNSVSGDSKGNVYIGTWGTGIWKYTDQLTPITLKDSTIVISHTYSTFVDNKDQLWIGTFGFGGVKVSEQGETIFSTNKGLLSDKVFSITQDGKGRIYLGTNGGGLSIIENDQLVTTITKNEGLAHSSIVSVATNNDYIFCGTVKGLSKINRTNTNQITNYGQWEGIDAESVNSSMAMANNGNLWIGTDKGLFAFHPDEDIPLNVYPEVSISSVQINYGKVNINQYSDSIHQISGLPINLILPYYQNRLTFNYEGIAMNYADELKYSYRLLGLDSNYSPLANINEITFHDLKHGSYTFEVIANIRGIKSNKAQLHFTILEPFWLTWWFICLVIFIALLSIYLVLRWRTAKLRKDKLLLENTVRDRTSELRTQKEIVEEKNREILDSINYAKRIQSAILPPDKVVKEYLENSFILYKPKDIVAGDFYWMESISPFKGGLKGDDNNSSLEGGVKVGENHPSNSPQDSTPNTQYSSLVLFAAADCTGHGVPGAMVSVVCNNALNRSVREYGLSDPGKILDKTREIVIEEFKKSEQDVKDGMDIALCSLQQLADGCKLKYAGAHNPLWIIRSKRHSGSSVSGYPESVSKEEIPDQVRDDEYELIEIKGNKQPIGEFYKNDPFTTHSFELQKGDTIYIFSDGYVDQFGGEKGKKFKSSSFRQLLLSIQDKSMSEQKQLIDQAFEQWRGNLEQVDDVCVIGVRI